MNKSGRHNRIPVAAGTGQIPFGETDERESHALAALDVLPDDEPLLTKAKREKKHWHGFDSIEKEKCLTPGEAFEWVRDGGNYGFALPVDGDDFGNLGVLDIEEPDLIPDDVIEWADEHALLAYESPHGGKNRLLRLTPEAHGLLNEADTKIDVDGDGEHEIELLAHMHAIGPGSIINHAHCDQNKPCSGAGDGEDQYRLASVNESRPLVTPPEVRELLDLLDVDLDEESDGDTTSERFGGGDLSDATESPDTSCNTSKTAKESVEDPENSVEYNVDERLERMFESEKGEKIRALWEGRYMEMGWAKEDRADHSKAEMSLASELGWWFENNERLVHELINRACREYPKADDGRNRKWSEAGGNYQRNTTIKGCNHSWTYTPPSDQLPFEERDDVGIPIRQRVHRAVDELENPDLSDILEHDRVDRSKRQVQRALETLIEDGYVEKRPDVLDARKNVYCIPDTR